MADSAGKARRQRSTCKQKVSQALLQRRIQCAQATHSCLFCERCAKPWGRNGLKAAAEEQSSMSSRRSRGEQKRPESVIPENRLVLGSNSKALAASAARAAATLSASTSHLSSRSGASRRRGAVQRRSQIDRMGLSALGSKKQKVRLELALQQRQRLCIRGSQAARAARCLRQSAAVCPCRPQQRRRRRRMV